MKLYVLDTDHVSLFQRKHPQVTTRVGEKPPEQLAVTIITVEEQLRGRLAQLKRAKSSQAVIKAFAELREAVQYFNNIQILDFDAAADDQFTILRQRRIRVGVQDLRIAAIVLATGNILVTRNRQDFGQIPGLAIDDWSLIPPSSQGNS
jgi:tRNA(fMet)-specific endonuclease VapC